MSLPLPEIWTYHDATERILDRFAVELTARNRRIARQAVQNARREVLLKNSTPGWSYFNRRFYFTTEASYSTGTVAYDHTGGANERQVTLTGGTWPANARYGRVKLGGIAYDVDKRVSDTIVTLREDQNPGADITSGAVFTWFRSAYPVNSGFTQTTQFQRADSTGNYLMYVTSQDGQCLRNYDTPGEPTVYTIRGAGEVYGQVNVELYPPPSRALTYQSQTQVSPRPLVIEKESTGTVSVTSGSTTVTGSGTAFTSQMAGSIIRLSANGSAEPTSSVGGLDNTVNPAAMQGTIAAYGSATSLTLLAEADQTLTNVKYTISDPLDLEPVTMLNLFWALADYEMAKEFRSEQLGTYLKLVPLALAEALGLDSPRARDKVALPWPWRDARLRDVADSV